MRRVSRLTKLGNGRGGIQTPVVWLHYPCFWLFCGVVCNVTSFVGVLRDLNKFIVSRA